MYTRNEMMRAALIAATAAFYIACLVFMFKEKTSDAEASTT